MHERKSGFSLIELLVVIAIIAILAAILFPLMFRAKTVSKRATCLNNLKQLGTAAHIYADNWNDTYMPARPTHWPFGDWNDGHPDYKDDYLGPRLLIKYVKNNKVFFCPANKTFTIKNYWKPGNYYMGYCYWGNYLREEAGQKILNESQVAIKAGQHPYSLLFSDIIVTALDWNSHSPREVEGGNLLYNDGHAKWKHFKQMKYLCTITGPPAVNFYW